MRVLLLSLCAVSAASFASLTSASSLYVIAYSGEKTAAVSVEKDADYASIAVEIRSDQKEPAAQYAEIKQIEEQIISKAGDRNDVEIHRGPITLSAEPIKTSLAVSSGWYQTKSSTTRLHILVKFDEKSTIYDCALRIRSFLASIKLPAKAEFELGPIQLAVKDPQQHRSHILKKIGEDVQSVKESVGVNGKVVLTGLQQPVMVRQLDDRKVELFINYTMSLELPESK